MNFLMNMIKGVIIGIGAVAPGVSGGTFAVILGIYDKLTDAIANFFKDYKNKLIFLIPLALGIGIGILGFSKIMKYLFENYESEVKFLFIGLMIGTLPFVVKEANKKGFKYRYLIACVITFSITLLAVFMENMVTGITLVEEPGVLMRTVYGGVIGIGTIVPGISSSFILMYIGAYEFLLDGIVSFNIPFMIPVGLGFGLSILMFAKVIQYFFKKFYGYTYYTILGFVIGSILTLIPDISARRELVIEALLCFIGFLLSYQLNARMQKKNPNSQKAL